MKKIPMLLLIAAPYIVLITAAAHLTDGIGYALALMFLLGILPNLVYPFFLPRMGYTPKQLFFWDMLCKLCHIPAYVWVFLLGVLSGISVLFITIVPFLILFDYALLLSSSMYGVSGLIRARRLGRFSKPQAILYGIMHFGFCIDVLGAVLCWLAVRKRPEDAQP